MIEKIIAQHLQIKLNQVHGTILLLNEGATIPFISRYRKEATGSLDEVQVAQIKEQLAKFTDLVARRERILSTIEGQGLLTGELKSRIKQCWNPTELEDIYMPYKPKRRTRATIARERGLEPLATLILLQKQTNIELLAKEYTSEAVPSVGDAVAGAQDIIAEIVNEEPKARDAVRRLMARSGIIRSKVVKGKEDVGVKFSDYFEASSPLKNISSHRFLAMQRGEDEGVLKISIDIDSEEVIDRLYAQFIVRNSTTADLIEVAIKDSFKRLMRPSIEGELLGLTKQSADDGAIKVFAENLRQLLLGSPLGQKRVLAIDPGFRTGCKVVVLDSNGGLVANTTIYPHPPQGDGVNAAKVLGGLIEKHKIEAFAIGDGTAGRETEAFVRSMDSGVELFMVSEDGASIYSASAVAREEFGDYDLTVRGAVSIGRRLIDPLSELVKIDPKSIGVGQYQHSVDQGKLKGQLTTVVESCVNMVGVNINTASKHILTFISGLGSTLAQNITDYRALNGDFTSRRELLKVPRLGAKAYEQAAGFLRVVGGVNALDSSAVHPESYYIVEQMARDKGVTLAAFISDPALRKTVDVERYVSGEVGLPTVVDILEALDKRGLDPREELQAFSFDASVRSIGDLHSGMLLPGIVTNITAFGAFIDIGIKHDGLVHISHLADKFVSSPTDVVRLGQRVEAKVLEVDTVRGRVSLSLRK